MRRVWHTDRSGASEQVNLTTPPAVVAFLAQIAVEPVATRAGFIDEDQVCGLRWPLADEVINVTLAGADAAEVVDLSIVLFGDIGHRDGLFVDIQTDVECARVTHG
jgi:hypothetical protein